ncbi:MAG: heme ABC exporter ATP-binding protein CcmA [Alicyclobacillus sp.]|nr:heme ABC exporter ATP-binding protein CcmA [Alicyclobacillus sp.]
MKGVLALTGVYKEYNLRPVLEDVHLRLEPGQRVALSAPNGSGKSTLIQILAGLSRPTRGAVTWSGRPLDAAARRCLGVLLQQPMLYGDLTGRENLVFFARLYRLAEARQLADRWLAEVGLDDSAQVRVREYSKGMKQRLALARCLLHGPRVLLLDEPFDGLDTASRAYFEGRFDAFAKAGGTLFLVTHHPEEARQMDRQLTIRFGRVRES